jgi:hypothetical protein
MLAFWQSRMTRQFHDALMTAPACARDRIVDLADASFRVEWLIGRRWATVP